MSTSKQPRKPLRDGEELWPTMPHFTLGCCDCGLVHTHVITVHKVTARVGDGLRVEEDALSPDDYAVRIISWRNAKETEESREEKGVAIRNTRKKGRARKGRGASKRSKRG